MIDVSEGKKRTCSELRMKKEIVNILNLWGIENGWIVFSLFKVAQIWCTRIQMANLLDRMTMLTVMMVILRHYSTKWKQWTRTKFTIWKYCYKSVQFLKPILFVVILPFLGSCFLFPFGIPWKWSITILTRVGKTTIKRAFPLLREQS